MARSVNDLRQLQALPLSLKVKLSQDRIRQWVNEYGEDGCYVSFSGGKDSTVLLHLVRKLYPNITAAFVDTGLEYPEIREFVGNFDNVEWIKPKKTFRKVIEDYGYPFISKEVSERVYYAQKYLRWYFQHGNLDAPKKEIPATYGIMDLCGVERGGEQWNQILKTRIVPYEILEQFAESKEKGTHKIRELIGKTELTGRMASQFDFRKWKWLALSPYMISNKCCDVMKKGPMHRYDNMTGRVPMTGEMAQESRLRTKNWIKSGCNMFDNTHPKSAPLSFWMEQDVLQYIKENDIPICSVYGDVVEVDEVPGQMTWNDYCGFDVGTQKLKTTGVKRTGCMFCGYGCHLDKPGEGRFERMKVTHPKQYEWIMKPWEQGGLGYRDVIDWLNENGDLHIAY